MLTHTTKTEVKRTNRQLGVIHIVVPGIFINCPSKQTNFLLSKASLAIVLG